MIRKNIVEGVTEGALVFFLQGILSNISLAIPVFPGGD